MSVSENALAALHEGLRRATHHKTGELALNVAEIVAEALSERGFSIEATPRATKPQADLPHAVRALLSLRVAAADLTWVMAQSHDWEMAVEGRRRDSATMRPFCGDMLLPDLLADVVRAQATLGEILTADETAALRRHRDGLE